MAGTTNTGVVLGLTDNVSASAQKIASELNNVAGSGDKINNAFDPAYLEKYNQELEKIGESYTKLNNQRTGNQSSQGKSFTGITGGITSGVVQAGGGDFAGGGLSAVSGLSGLLAGLGPLGIGIMSGIGILGGTNALSNQYEKRSPSAMKISMMEKGPLGSINENTEALREAMATTVEAVSQYGKTYSEGASARQAYVKAGGSDFIGQSESAKYSTGYGADMNRLSSFEGMTSRYGQGRGLDVTRALLKTQGLGGGQFEEVLSGIEEQFSSFLSRGVVKNLSSMAMDQAYFSGAGPTFQGGLGSQKLGQMNQAVIGASNMQNQTDMFLYRSASELSGGGLLETKKLMEGGMTQDLFKGLIKQFNQFGYGEDESILQLSKMMGLSVTDAEALYKNRDKKKDSEYWANFGTEMGETRTRESSLIDKQENITQAISGVGGAVAMDAKLGLIELIEAPLNAIVEKMTTPKEISAETMFAHNMEVKMMNVMASDNFGGKIYNKLMYDNGEGYSETMDIINKGRMSGVTENQIQDTMISKIVEAMDKKGVGGESIVLKERELLSELMKELIQSTKETTEAVLSPTFMEEE